MITVYQTQDGSKTLLNTDLNETYHSRHGAVQESLHVFIQAGLEDFIASQQKISPLRILEIGFGTGLNALLSLQASLQKNISVYYESIETLPLPYAQVQELGYIEQIGNEGLEKYFETMHVCAWDKEINVTENFILHKRRISLSEYRSTKKFHIVYFDAFAPNVQSEMWTIEALSVCTHALETQGFFVTYCAKGQLKRDLKSLGMLIESLPGARGKREMTRAVKPI